MTKVVATTTMAMILYESGLLELDVPIAETAPEFLADSVNGDEARRRQVTFRMLLAHTSGLPAYEKLFLKTRSRDELLKLAFSTLLPPIPDRARSTATSDSSFLPQRSRGSPKRL